MDLPFKAYRSMDAVAMREAVQRGELTPSTLLGAARDRLAAVNPTLNAVCIDMSDRAQAQLEGSFDDGSGEAPFGGVPFLIKDIIQDYAGVPATSGSRALRDYRPALHSDYVRRALDAGLVIFGKTATPEFALKGITESALWGATRNPWNTGHTPGGSSGGSAAAVAAGVVPMAGANDGGGSIRIPASHCGLFGLRPSRGRVPVTPMAAEHWEGASSDGVVSRSVRDSARMLDVLAGPGRGAPFHVAAAEASFEALAQRAPGQLRIGMCTRSPIDGDVDPECERAVAITAQRLSALGHHVEEVEPAVDGHAVARAYLTLYFGQVAASVDAALAQGARASDFELDTRTLASIGRALSAGEYVSVHRQWNVFGQAMADYFDRFDIYLTPTVASPPVAIGALEPSAGLRMMQRASLALPTGRLLLASGIVDKLVHESLEKTPFTQLANLTGTPAMSVPMHWTGKGLPIGVQCVAPWGGEGRLLSLAAQMEADAPWFDRVPADA